MDSTRASRDPGWQPPLACVGSTTWGMFAQMIANGADLVSTTLASSDSGGDILRVLSQGRETDWLEFKARLVAPRSDGDTSTGTREPKKDDYAFNVVRAVAALANTDGGAILLGVDDRGGVVGLEGCLVRVPPDPEHARRVVDFIARKNPVWNLASGTNWRLVAGELRDHIEARHATLDGTPILALVVRPVPVGAPFLAFSQTGDAHHWLVAPMRDLGEVGNTRYKPLDSPKTPKAGLGRAKYFEVLGQRAEALKQMDDAQRKSPDVQLTLPPLGSNVLEDTTTQSDPRLDDSLHSFPPLAGSPVIRVLLGPYLYRYWRLERGTPLTIGRGDGCGLRLSDATVSRGHAQIWLDHGDVWIKDLGSSNKTKVNGRVRDRAGTLSGGEDVSVGDVPLRLEYLTDRQLVELDALAKLAEDPRMEAGTGIHPSHQLDRLFGTLANRAVRNGDRMCLAVLVVDDHSRLHDPDSTERVTTDQVVARLAMCVGAAGDEASCVRLSRGAIALLFPRSGREHATSCVERVRRAVLAHAWGLEVPGLIGVTVSAGVMEADPRGLVSEHVKLAEALRREGVAASRANAVYAR